MGYQQQRGYPERLPEILAAVCECLSASGGVDFILHGGDMIDCTSEGNIAAAADAFDLPVPVYLCLGNHDLTRPDAVEQWLALAPQFFINGAPDYTVVSRDCVVHVAPNHWCECPFYWKDTQHARLSPAQTERLRRELSMQPNLAHVLLTHSPVYGLPVAQTGFSEPYHCPDLSFTGQVSGFAEAHRALKCVLGAHSHMNMRVTHDGVDFVTVSSLVETPFEVKLFEVTAERMEMSTIALRSALTFGVEYETGRSFVQGRPVDRSFSRGL